MIDKVFGELNHDYGFFETVSGKTIKCFGEESEVRILILAEEEEDGISDVQYEAYNSLMEKWDEVQEAVADSIINYYNKEEKGAYGPSDEEEFKTWWPDIETRADVALNVHLESIVIPPEFLMDGERTITLCSNRDWGGEDLDDNGVAVRLVDEEVDEVGYKDIAY